MFAQYKGNYNLINNNYTLTYFNNVQNRISTSYLFPSYFDILYIIQFFTFGGIIFCFYLCTVKVAIDTTKISPPFEAFISRQNMESLGWSQHNLGTLLFIPEFLTRHRGSIRAVLFGVINRYIKLLSLVGYICVGKTCSVPSINNRRPSSARNTPT